MRTGKMLLIGCLPACAVLTFGLHGLAAEPVASLPAWVARLRELRHHNAAAFNVGPKLVVLEPDFGLRVLEAAWPELQNFEVKRGLLKAFAFSKPLRPGKHPRLLGVLHLGMTDPDYRVRQWASAYVASHLPPVADDDLAAYKARWDEVEKRAMDSLVDEAMRRRRPELRQKLENMVEALKQGDMGQVQELGEEICEHRDPIAIPILIGIIDADNSYDTVFGVGAALDGSTPLGSLVNVGYSPFHDGAWWRRWWDKHKGKYPLEEQEALVPELPKTEHGKRHLPFPENMDTLEGKLAYLRTFLKGSAGRILLRKLLKEIAKHKDPRAIPELIALIEADNTYDTIYGVGRFGLKPITGVPYSKTHDGDWWRQWWEANKSNYPTNVRSVGIADYRELVTSWKVRTARREREEAPADVADVPAEDLTVPHNQKMRYFLIGPRKEVKPPEAGFKLVVVMPGGDGGEAFLPFVKRLYKYGMSDEFLVAQPVAFKWHEHQVIVWPTRMSPAKGQEFATEDFIEAVIKDAGRRYPVDEECVYTLSWSSGGPAAYAIALQERTAVRGSYVLMSVYRPDGHPPVAGAKGRVFLLEHSPQDRICPYAHARQAEKELREAGGTVRLVTYQGGHGWHGNIYERVKSGISWLTRKRKERDRADTRSAR